MFSELILLRGFCGNNPLLPESVFHVLCSKTFSSLDNLVVAAVGFELAVFEVGFFFASNEAIIKE